MAWPAPMYSRNRIKKAGKEIARVSNKDGFLAWHVNIDHQEFEVVENWRTSHGAVLNTAQAWLRRLDKLQRPIVGQRLKRYNTIVDKLVTGRAKDLSTMHDIAGVRAIFRSLDELYEFRGQMRLSKAKHLLTHDPAKYDYLTKPKTTGYRGIHEVMERKVASRFCTHYQDSQGAELVIHSSKQEVDYGAFRFERCGVADHRAALAKQAARGCAGR